MRLLCSALVFVYSLFSVHLSSALAENHSVVVIYQEEKNITLEIAKRLEARLISNDYESILLPYSESSLQEIDKLNSKKLIITFGTNVTKEILSKNLEAPVLSLLIPKHSYEILLDAKKGNHAWIANFIDHPPYRQLSLIKHLLGKNKKVGTILGPYSSKDNGALTASAKKHRQKLYIETIDATDHLISSLK